MSYWQGKVAVVTGGSSGLGYSAAAALAAAGAAVTIVARDASRLESAARQLRAINSSVQAFAADITRDADVANLLADVVGRGGRLDMLVNCAGRSTRAALMDVSPEQFQDLLEINFLALVRCTRAAMPQLLKSRGHVINVGSLASKVAGRFLGAYPASKFPVAAYSQQLRLELGPQGLHVLLVCPGPLARDEVRSYVPPDSNIPESARGPGGGAKVSSLDPDLLAQRILKACEQRRPELVLPGRARLLFAAGALSPRLGDWLLRKFSG